MKAKNTRGLLVRPAASSESTSVRILGRGGFGALGTDEHLPRCSDMDSDLRVYPYVIFLRPELAVQLDASIEGDCFFVSIGH